MLWLILGDYAAGKTLFLVLKGFSAKGSVWGNFDLYIDDYLKIEPMDLKNLGKNNLVLLDEMQTWLESRTSMSFLNRFVTNIINQVDKKDVDVYGTAHSFMSIDVRFRENCHRIVKCERIGPESRNKSRYNDNRDFRFSTINTFTGKTMKKKRLRYKKAIKYFDKYKTDQTIEYPNEADMLLDLLLTTNQEKGYEELLSIAKQIKKGTNGNKITHADAEVGLLKLGYSAKHGRLVYSIIQSLRKKK